MTNTARARILAVVGGASLALALLAPAAHAQLDAVGGVTDTVGGVTSGVTDGGGTSSGGGGGTSSGGGGGTTSTIGSIGSTVGGVTETIGGGGSTSDTSDGDDGSLIGGVTDGIKKTVDKTKETAEQTSGDLNNNVTEIVGGVTNEINDTTGGTLDKVTESVIGTPGSKKTKKNGDKNTTAGSRSRTSGSLVMGSDLAAAMRADSKVIPSGARRNLSDAALATSVTAAPASLAEQIGLIARAAAEQMAFPALLMAIVIGFLMIQNRIDRRDPKLAMAPVDSEHDLLSFS